MNLDPAAAALSEREKKAHKTECEKEVDLCHETINTNQADCDKQLLTLTSGLLALVIAFVRDIVPLSTAVYVLLFYGTLVFSVLCMLSVLFSYQLSIVGHFKAKEFWETKRCGEDNSNFPYRYASYVRRVNLISAALFFIAVILLIVFIILNVAMERTVAEKTVSPTVQTIEKGANLKAPSQAPTQDGSNLRIPAQTPVSTVHPSQGTSGGTQTGKQQP